MWTLENLAAGAVHLGLVMYAVFGGADFGGGIWTALASGPRAREQREGLFNAIGPVWETNHIWLIFVVVTLFTAFPKPAASAWDLSFAYKDDATGTWFPLASGSAPVAGVLLPAW